MRTPKTFLSSLLVLALGAASAAAQRPPAGPPGPAPTGAVPAEAESPIASTELFELWSDFDLNLHHFLYQWATTTDEGKRRRVEISERGAFDGLPEREHRDWTIVLTFYRARVIDRNLLFDEDLVALRDALTGKRSRAGLPGLAADALTMIERAAPVYRRVWWAKHDAANRAWADALAAKLRKHETTLANGLAEAYGGSVPAAPIRLDVSAYANTVGGYTTSDAHIVMASTTPPNPMPQALEMVFHELSHADPLEGPLREAIGRAFEAAGVEPPDDLWHMMIFHTAGELTRRAFADSGGRNYETYSAKEGMFTRRPARRAYLAALEAHWTPFLAGEGRRGAALRKIADDLIAAGAAAGSGGEEGDEEPRS